MLLYPILMAIMLIGCTSIDQEFENKSKSCTLKLYETQKYTYRFPHFFGHTLESGTYTILGTNLILTREEKNNYPESDFTTTWLYENPNKLKFRFNNINREKVDVEFLINESSKKFNSVFGELEITYEELENKQLIPNGGQVTNLNVYFNDKNYVIDSMDIDINRRPTHFDITLNEFKNERYAFLRRSYEIEENRILMNDINIKNVGSKNRYLLKKEIL